MNTEATIPCPVCHDPILVRYVNLQSGEIARVYTEPMLSMDESIVFHAHQVGDLDRKLLH